MILKGPQIVSKMTLNATQFMHYCHKSDTKYDQHMSKLTRFAIRLQKAAAPDRGLSSKL